MGESRRLILLIAVGLLVLAAVLAVVITVKKGDIKTNLLGAQTGVSPTPAQEIVSPSLGTSPTSAPSPISQLTTKTYQGQGFSLKYPSSWGLLTCTNSVNIELDPQSSTDQKISCNFAVKPITILVKPTLSCQGETTRIGSLPVVKSRSVDSRGEVSYRWCVNLGNESLDISHRVANFQAPAASKNDYSSQIQQMIFDITSSGAVPS